MGDLGEAPGRAGLGDPEPGSPSPGFGVLRADLAGRVPRRGRGIQQPQAGGAPQSAAGGRTGVRGRGPLPRLPGHSVRAAGQAARCAGGHRGRLGARHGGDRRDVRPGARRPAPGPDPGVHAVGAARTARPGRGGGGAGVDVPAADRPPDGAAAGRRPADQVGSGHRPRTAVRTSRRLGHLRGHRGRGQSDVQYAGPASHADAPHTAFNRPAVVGRSLPHRHHARGASAGERIACLDGHGVTFTEAGESVLLSPSPGGSVRPG